MNPADSDSSEEIDDDFGGNSEPDVEVASTFDEVIALVGVDCARAAMARGFQSLDQVTLDTEFRSRGCLMRVVPKVMRGAARTAGNVEQETREVVHACATNVNHQNLLGVVPCPAKLAESCNPFARGEWMLLVKASRADAQSNSAATLRQREESSDERGRRAKRALQLTQWGELSSARQALEGALVALGNEETLSQLTDPSRRPAVPRTPIIREFVEHNPEDQVVMDGEVLLKNLRNSRRGAVAGPSGLTGDHLRVILDSESDCVALCEFARVLVVGKVPREVMKAIRLGRVTALSKPDGGVRGIVVGDFLRRLVARTLVQQFSQAV